MFTYHDDVRKSALPLMQSLTTLSQSFKHLSEGPLEGEQEPQSQTLTYNTPQGCPNPDLYQQAVSKLHKWTREASDTSNGAPVGTLHQDLSDLTSGIYIKRETSATSLKERHMEFIELNLQLYESWLDDQGNVIRSVKIQSC
ncbi:hypothetical protein TREMEDRAFT_61517 [Tremella mesenterica DSM 1558]|uniref:uncharacterized protein n=1 Tax=Tremella mesenterica (strain ATCC 24925 / CBS 8224 / DSM 1558 / NBRC 9311 / NRRL Y-6157 / RJB 2259-6 / UBC 559-6) TaxID=578456 RepID=UPI0003F49B28|nr:uncharacterized protein TREMEDRAFT_61517 [Tremella mesenterica DSM 1558]EIW69753.1 hypothetical protein TREMEDRAFT_61517 [Tremella mesenterica DSM 1558]